MRFFLGTHETHWLAKTTVPLFLSDRRLRTRRSLPVAAGEWALDSGGFTELSTFGSWDHGPTPHQYVQNIRRYTDVIGGLRWAAPQDWMCEPEIIAKTGLSVAEHQHRTVTNVATLRSLAPDLPIAPVLQGWHPTDYLDCVDRYLSAGIDLATEPIVGVGSVCRRQGTAEAAEIIARVTSAVPGIRLHGFGCKVSGLHRYGSLLTSADSMAWSAAARRNPPLPGCSHRNCANCLNYALQWRDKQILSRPEQLLLDLSPKGEGQSGTPRAFCHPSGDAA